MIHYIVIAGTLIAGSSIAASGLTQSILMPTPLPDRDGDGRITLSKRHGPFRRGTTVIRCEDKPAYTYGVTCVGQDTKISPTTPTERAPVRPVVRITSSLLLDPESMPRGRLQNFTGEEVWANRYPAAPINDSITQNVAATCSRTCVVIGRASHGNIVRDSTFTRNAPATRKSQIDAGIRVGGGKGGVAVNDVLIERIRSYGWRMEPLLRKYANGDGIVINRGVKKVTIRHSRFDDNSDGGVDTKADLTILDTVSASNNEHYGFRFWGSVQATTLTSANNTWGAIEVEPGARVVIDRLIMIGSEELVTSKAGADVTIKSCDLSRWTGKALTKGEGHVTLGSGCKLQR